MVSILFASTVIGHPVKQRMRFAEISTYRHFDSCNRTSYEKAAKKYHFWVRVSQWFSKAVLTWFLDTYHLLNWESHVLIALNISLVSPVLIWWKRFFRVKAKYDLYSGSLSCLPQLACCLPLLPHTSENWSNKRVARQCCYWRGWSCYYEKNGFKAGWYLLLC